MSLNLPAKITFPLDIPGADVLHTELIPERHSLITVESRQETTTCGICQQEIRCNYGHGSEICLRHLPVLGEEPLASCHQLLHSSRHQWFYRRR